MEKYIEKNGITYELRGEQYYPLLELPEQKEIGRWGLLHLGYPATDPLHRVRFCTASAQSQIWA